jgi:cysteinyl-tRNA synthetase
MDLTLYNTKTRTKEKFVPLHSPEVSMYNCGPTVYNFAHIGNLRAYVFADTLRRVLEWNEYTVHQVVNITDVGHLVTDADEGEDKMQVGAQREGKTVEEIITLYSDAFFADLHTLHVLPAAAYPRATQYIEQQKAMVEVLHKKGYTYLTSDGVYFDTSKFPAYREFAQLDIEGLHSGQRVAMGEKHNPTDFAVWKFSPETNAKREQEWNSPIVPERMGFPGWHIECSAIIKALLGDTIDIHTGGVDHIPVHHTNEIAQSETANAVEFVRYWVHCAHILVDGQKMSKSLGNTYRLSDLQLHGIPAQAFRYWLLTAHYRTQPNFTWEALEGAHASLQRLLDFALTHDTDATTVSSRYMDEFSLAINDDLNTAQAIASMWNMLKDNSISNDEKVATLYAFDRVLGIGLKDTIQNAKAFVFPKDIQVLVAQRAQARSDKDWSTSDKIRDELEQLGYEVKDGQYGQQVHKKIL